MQRGIKPNLIFFPVKASTLLHRHLTKKERQKERGVSDSHGGAENQQAGVALTAPEWIKTEAPLCLFRLFRSVWPQERNPVGNWSQGDSWTQRPVHKPEFGAINGTHILRLQIPFCYSVRCVISRSSCEKQGYARYSLTGFFEKL